MKLPTLVIVSAALAAPGALAQQFQQVGSGLPGPVVWSEGVDVTDADGDGRFDIVFANGVGFNSAMGALAPTLLLNQTTAAGPIAFIDASSDHLPVGFVQQAKHLLACDVDGDGDDDLVFANGFLRQPSLLINDGLGHFTDQTSTRFPVLSLSSFGVGFGDVDNDGDLDLVFADAGPSAFGAPGGLARLLINDGTGVFTNSPARMNAVNKIGAQNAQLLDIDNDFDLDVLVDGKSAGLQLYFNDGTGSFALQAPSGLPTGTNNTYATDFADLDNDLDLDGLYISFTGFNEGSVRNDLIPGGSLTFTGATAAIGGHNGEDDNDIVFVDTNNDGRLDAIVGSLGWTQEKLYLNDGTWGTGAFAYQSTGFTALTDSTLDLAVGDFDLDGRYDIVTAQGESGTFTNRVYRNTGPSDTQAPWVGRIEAGPALVPLETLASPGAVRRAWIQDGTYKRGKSFVTARVDATATKGSSSQSFSTDMIYAGGGLHRANLQPPASPTGRVGLTVSYVVHASDPSGNASDSAALEFRVCGAERFGSTSPNSVGKGADLTPVNSPGLAANNFAVAIDGLPPLTPASLFLGDARLEPAEPLGAGLRFVGGTTRRVAWALADAAGHASFGVDLTARSLVGIAPGSTRYFQVQYQDPTKAAFLNASDALEVVFCP